MWKLVEQKFQKIPLNQIKKRTEIIPRVKCDKISPISSKTTKTLIFTTTRMSFFKFVS